MNTALHRAKQEKNDEYYTLLEDIENELTHYPTTIFANKHVHLPCDDPAKSTFFTYFTQNLTASSSANSPQSTTRRAPPAP